jgi:hypothetical protein
MKTFTEALKAVSVCESADQEEDRLRTQQEFRDEVFNNDIAVELARGVSMGVLQLSGDKESASGDALISIYLNGLLLGVAVGVQMERNEVFVKTSIWRRAWDKFKGVRF